MLIYRSTRDAVHGFEVGLALQIELGAIRRHGHIREVVHRPGLQDPIPEGRLTCGGIRAQGRDAQGVTRPLVGMGGELEHEVHAVVHQSFPVSVLGKYETHHHLKLSTTRLV